MGAHDELARWTGRRRAGPAIGAPDGEMRATWRASGRARDVDRPGGEPAEVGRVVVAPAFRRAWPCATTEMTMAAASDRRPGGRREPAATGARGQCGIGTGATAGATAAGVGAKAGVVPTGRVGSTSVAGSTIAAAWPSVTTGRRTPAHGRRRACAHAGPAAGRGPRNVPMASSAARASRRTSGRRSSSLADEGRGPVAGGRARRGRPDSRQGAWRPRRPRCVSPAMSRSRPIGLERGELQSFADVGVVHHSPISIGMGTGRSPGSWSSARSARMCRSARRVRVFTVPSGQPRRSAISDWVSPSRVGEDDHRALDVGHRRRGRRAGSPEARSGRSRPRGRGRRRRRR